MKALNVLIRYMLFRLFKTGSSGVRPNVTAHLILNWPVAIHITILILEWMDGWMDRWMDGRMNRMVFFDQTNPILPKFSVRESERESSTILFIQ